LSIGLGDSLKARIRRYKELCAHYGMTPSRNMRTARSPRSESSSLFHCSVLYMAYSDSF
jgi:hypothetical protein